MTPCIPLPDAPVPEVSVVIPTYNGGSRLLETLQTVFSQTFTDFEVVVVDDGSTDETPRLLGPLAAERKIRLVQQANGGVGPARNRGIAEARGRYVALLDHDDLWRPRKLEIQVAYAKKHPACSIVLVPWAFSNAPDRWMFNPDCIGDDGIVARPLLREAQGNSLICSSAMLFARERASGLRYGEQRRCIEDQEFHIGMLARGAVGVAGDEILMVYRWHGANTSSEAEYWYQGVKRLRRLERAGQFSSLTGETREDLHHFLAHMSRTATANLLLAGRRLSALALWIREFPHQLRERRLKYLATVPLLALGPRPLIHRAFAGGRS